MLEWGYVAGFLDGDGSIILVQRKISKNRRWMTIEPRITFTNSEKKAIVALGEFLGVPARVYRSHPKGTWPYRKPQWRLQFGGFKKVRNVLKNCIPHLIIKRDIAELVLRFVDSRLPKIGRRLGYSEEELNILRQVRSLRGRKGWENRLEVLQHPQNNTES